MAIESTVGTVWDIVYQLRLRFPSVPSALYPDYQLGYFPVEQSDKSIYYADDPMVPILLPAWLKAYDPHTSWWVSRHSAANGGNIGAHTPIAIPVFPTNALVAIGSVHSGLRTGNNLPYTLTVVGVTCQLRFVTGTIPAGDLPANEVRIDHPMGLVPTGQVVGSTNFGLAGAVPGDTSTDLTVGMASREEFGSNTTERFLFAYGGADGTAPMAPPADLTTVTLVRDYGTPPPTALMESAGEASSGVGVRVSALPVLLPEAMMGSLRLTPTLAQAPAKEEDRSWLTRPRVEED